MQKHDEQEKAIHRYFENNQRLIEIRDCVQVGIWVIEMETDAQPRMYADFVMRKLLGVAPDVTPEQCYQIWWSNIFSSYINIVQQAFDRVLVGKKTEVTYPWMDLQGNLMYVRCGMQLGNQTEKQVSLYGYHQDITEMILEQKQPFQVENFSEYVLNVLGSLYQAIHVINLDCEEVTMVKTTRKKVYQGNNIPLEEYWRVVRTYLKEETVQKMKDFCNPQNFSQGCSSQSEDFSESLQGHPYWVNITMCKAELELHHTVVVAFQDISERKREQQSNDEKIAYFKAQSELDGLTKIRNRKGIEDKIGQVIKEDSCQTGAFLLIDLDNFKEVNDKLGHIKGDIVLMETAEHLKQLCTPQDEVGRLGGDEFVVFLKNRTSLQQVQDCATSITRLLKKKYWIREQRIEMGASIGIALYPDQGKTFDALYHIADKALYQSKKRGKGCSTVWEQDEKR